MRQHKRPLLLLIIGVISFAALAALIYFSSPSEALTLQQFSIDLPFSIEGLIKIPTVILFFLLIIAFLFSIGSYILKSTIQGILIAAFVTIYLVFRLSHLTSLFFLVLLLALFITLELFVSNKR